MDLLQYHWHYHNKIEGMLGFTKNRMVTIYADAQLEQTMSALEQLHETSLQSFCLQDVMDPSSVFSQAALRTFLECYYPAAAPWEASNVKPRTAIEKGR